ncbi:MAG TPA: hypothetical protein VF756_18980 [Thermoanaerobaculia bacterium]
MTRPDRCDRFETEGLLQLERGESLGDHFATCPDCREERAVYERLRQDLAALGADEEPSPDWQARVRQRVEQRRRRRLSWGWVLAPLGATALAATLFFAMPRTPSSPSLAQEVVESGSIRRAAGARPGDRLVLRAETAGSPHAELRVYRNRRDVVLRCPGDPSCHRDGGELSASLTFPSVGDYQAVLVLGPEPLPPPGKGLDPDAGAAFTRGAQVLLGDEISVR